MVVRRLVLLGLIVAGALLLIALPGFVLAQGDDPAAPTAVPTVEPTPAAPGSAPAQVVHSVIGGESLFSIAILYGTTVAELQRLNGLNVDAPLQIGQQIVISGVAPLPYNAQIIDDPALRDVAGLPPVPKVHIVQGGDALTALATQYGVTLDDLLAANLLTPDAPLAVGQPLIIPGIVGDLIARDYTVQIGDTLAGVAAAFRTRADWIARGNALLNPDRLIAGQTIQLVSRTGSVEPTPPVGTPHVVVAGETLLTIAARHKLSPVALANANGLPYPAAVVPGARLRIPRGDQPYRPLGGELRALRLSRDALVQGEAFAVYVETVGNVTPTGRLEFTSLVTPSIPYYNDYAQSFPFTRFGDGFLALVGLDAFTPPGLYRLDLLTGGDVPTFSQPLRVAEGNWGLQQINVGAELAALLDPAVRQRDDAMLLPIYASLTLTRHLPLTTPLASPLDGSYLSAAYGDARSYNSGPYEIFHSGIDFAAPVGTPVYAAADGVVVFSALTELRGNMIVLDHGLGFMTSYSHLDSRIAQQGDVVSAGQAIGGMGATGLVTGAHLHWEIRIHNVPVNGLTWLREAVVAPALP